MIVDRAVHAEVNSHCARPVVGVSGTNSYQVLNNIVLEAVLRAVPAVLLTAFAGAVSVARRDQVGWVEELT